MPTPTGCRSLTPPEGEADDALVAADTRTGIRVGAGPAELDGDELAAVAIESRRTHRADA